MRKKTPFFCNFSYAFIFRNCNWNILFFFLFFSSSLVPFNAQNIQDHNTDAQNEIFVSNGAFIYNESHISGKIVHEEKIKKVRENLTKSNVPINHVKKQKSLSDKRKTTQHNASLSSKVNYKFAPTKNTDSFCQRFNRSYFAVHQIDSSVKKDKGKVLSNIFTYPKFYDVTSNISIGFNYFFNYNLPYYLLSLSIRPPPNS